MMLPQRPAHLLAVPSWPLTLLTVVLCVAFVALGRWQWHRGELRERDWAAFARGTDAPQPLDAKELDGLARFTRVSLHGRYLPQRQFLLDNRSHAGSAGYEVLTPFELADGRVLLVDRGWIASSGYRARLPAVGFAAAPGIEVSGRLAELPSAGLAFGRTAPALAGGWPRLATYPRMQDLSAALGRALESRIVLLDAQQAQGYVRDWQPPGLPPARHWAYAIQWWCFAATLVVLWTLMAVRHARKPS